MAHFSNNQKDYKDKRCSLRCPCSLFFILLKQMCEKHFKNSRKGKEVVNMGLDMYAFSVKKENRIDTFHIRHDENET